MIVDLLQRIRNLHADGTPHHTPQVHVKEFQPQLLDPLAQHGEDDGDQMIPLRGRVAEGRGDEDANCS